MATPDNRPISHHLRLAEAPRLTTSMPAAIRRRRGVQPGDPVPRIEVAVARAPLDAEWVRGYRGFCGFGAGSIVPLPLLFSHAYPTLVALLTHPVFPIRALGMVHTGFEVEVDRPLVAGETPSLVARLIDWRQERAGWEVETEIDLLDGPDGASIGRARITTMARGGGHGRAKAAPERSGPPDAPASPIALTADVGRRFAKVSGDWNPIHLWPWSARLLGLRRPIAHGMFLVARSVALVGEHLGGERIDAASQLQVRFKTPAYLPGGAHCFVPEADDDAIQPFELWSANRTRPHVMGTLRIEATSR